MLETRYLYYYEGLSIVVISPAVVANMLNTRKPFRSQVYYLVSQIFKKVFK